ncbi:MAG: LysR family transcriptional regulator [Betaproteobacteria bacterium]|nr:LysR family transcriptional regulator [Betaproteobacteria bacterium]
MTGTLDPNDLLLFARIAEAGSFTRAAERVGLPKSTLSRRISALEEQLGERLLTRTTRKLVLTEVGTSLLEHARGVVEQTEAAANLVAHRQAEPSGHLRVSMPGDIAGGLDIMLAEFILRYPAVTLEVDLSPRRVDLVGESFDVAIRMGDLPDDATLTARRLSRFSTGLYASPAYIKRRGRAKQPDDLLEHDLLHILARSGGAMPWRLTRVKTVWEKPLPSRALVNSPELLTSLALRGAGITMMSDHNATSYLAEGSLQRILPEWSLPEVDGWAVFPGRRLMPAKTRVFLDALEAGFTQACDAIAGGKKR